MKGAHLTLERNGVEVRTKHLGKGMIEWIDEPKEYSRLVGCGWKVKVDDVRQRALKAAEDMWEFFCDGSKLTNEDFIKLTKILREDNEIS